MYFTEEELGKCTATSRRLIGMRGWRYLEEVQYGIMTITLDSLKSYS